MAFPEPEPGLVIRYAFLWGREAARGQEEGSKDRPCAVVLAAKKEGDKTLVVVAPITHTDPGKSPAVEIPAITKQRLGLDHDRSWIITSEVNVFEWPGPDLRPVSQGRSPADRRFDYGVLPPKTLMAMRDGVEEERERGRLAEVRRDDAPPVREWKQEQAKRPKWKPAHSPGRDDPESDR